MSNDYTLSVAHQALIDTVKTNAYDAFANATKHVIKTYDSSSISNISNDYVEMQVILKKLAREAKENTELEEEYPELKELKLRYEKLLAEIKLERLITK
jgi:cell shape-determining protein MreC